MFLSSKCINDLYKNMNSDLDDLTNWFKANRLALNVNKSNCMLLQPNGSQNTVEPLSNDHPHQRPSLLYDHILCDGHYFLFVRSLTNDHPSDATNDRIRWDCLPRERPPRLQCISKNRGWRFNIRSQPCSIITMLCLDTFQVIQLI